MAKFFRRGGRKKNIPRKTFDSTNSAIFIHVITIEGETFYNLTPLGGVLKAIWWLQVISKFLMKFAVAEES